MTQCSSRLCSVLSSHPPPPPLSRSVCGPHHRLQKIQLTGRECITKTRTTYKTNKSGADSKLLQYVLMCWWLNFFSIFFLEIDSHWTFQFLLLFLFLFSMSFVFFVLSVVYISWNVFAESLSSPHRCFSSFAARLRAIMNNNIGVNHMNFIERIYLDYHMIHWKIKIIPLIPFACRSGCSYEDGKHVANHVRFWFRWARHRTFESLLPSMALYENGNLENKKLPRKCGSTYN